MSISCPGTRLVDDDRGAVVMNLGLVPPAGPADMPRSGSSVPAVSARARARGRTLWIMIALALGFAGLAGQLLRLGLSKDRSAHSMRVAASSPIARSYARPDIVDRRGRLLATDLVGHSLYADPSQIIDADRAVEALLGLFPDFDARVLREKLSDRERRFEWIKRGLTPGIAQRAHDLGLPGIGLRREPKRTYPLGRLAGHLIGVVSVDNRGVSGIERHVDEVLGVEAAVSGEFGQRNSLGLTIDIGVQHALEEELASAVALYRAEGAAGVVLDVANGEIAALASLPEINPGLAIETQDAKFFNRMSTGRYELGSVFKTLTMALALETGQATLDGMIDVQGPLAVNGHEINDLYPAGRQLTARDVFLKSSNVGFGRLGLGLGADRIRSFFATTGLSGEMATEAGSLPAVRSPKRWHEAETATIAFGHGIAVTPLQFAVAVAGLINGGRRIVPRLVAGGGQGGGDSDRVVSSATSRKMRELLRLNVTSSIGTGRRADVPGYEVGGKTGTAEQASDGGYKRKSVISSFVAAFPMADPKYLTYVLLFEPQPVTASDGKITAGHNAAPVSARLIRRVAPLLGVAPRQ